MKNKLLDLNNHLFAQIERLSEETLTGEQLTHELQRTKAITGVAAQIIGNARLALDAQIAVHDNMIKNPALMLGTKGYDETE